MTAQYYGECGFYTESENIDGFNYKRLKFDCFTLLEIETDVDGMRWVYSGDIDFTRHYTFLLKAKEFLTRNDIEFTEESLIRFFRMESRCTVIDSYDED